MTLSKFRTATAIGLVIGAATLSGCMGPTYGTGRTSGEMLVSDLDGMMSLGSKKPGEAISYAPRAELVRPKDTTILPPPRDGVDSASDPNWPESPEVRSARIKAAADARDTGGPIRAEDALSAKEGVTQQQIAINSSGGRRVGTENGSTTLTPDELDSSRDAFKLRLRDSQQGSPTQRKYLSEPPVAYRAPASTAPVGDPGVDERVKEARLKKNDGLGSKIRGLLPF